MERAKVVLVGDSGVGKTSIFHRIQTKEFDPDINPTTCGAYAFLELEDEKQEVKIGLWDTAGQERFRTVVPIYFRNARYLIIVYAMNDQKTLGNVRFWHNISQTYSPSDCKLILVGNKSDLSRERTILENEIQFIQKEINAIVSFEVSALDGSNISIILKFIAQDIIQSNPDIYPANIIDTSMSFNDKKEDDISSESTFSFRKCCE
jgi:small GTP-binding protein